MPKAASSTSSLSCLFAVAKPSGLVCMPMLNSLNPLLAQSSLFKDSAVLSKPYKGGRKQPKVKLGQAGTLDPLASVIGVNNGTKHLSKLLNGVKEYKTTGLLGASTDSYDSEGKVVVRRPHSHITRDKVEAVLDKFRGEIQQFPPIYSALKMDGKALYEYARTNTPLPREIPARTCTIYDLQLVDWQNASSHSWAFPNSQIEEEAKAAFTNYEKLVDPTSTRAPEEKDEGVGPTFSLQMRVSSGTYVRSIVHDIGQALDSAAHVVALERTRQGDFVLKPTEQDTADGLLPCVDWAILQQAIDQLTSSAQDEKKDTDWETELLQVMQKLDP